MSYDIYFLHLQPGQTWDEAIVAMQEMGEQASDGEGGGGDAAPPQWDDVVTQARALLGEVSIFENPPHWELSHEATGIQLGNHEGEWELSVPYWTEGEAATQVVRNVYGLAMIVEQATGLRAYDAQLDQPVAELTDSEPQAATGVFDKVAKLFRRNNPTQA